MTQPDLKLEFTDPTPDDQVGVIKYRAAYVGSGDGKQEQSGAIHERLSTRDYDDLRWYAEDFSRLPEGGNLVRAEAVSKRFSRWGLATFGQLAGLAVNRWLREVDASNGGKVEIAASEPGKSSCMRAPWELLRVPDGRFLHDLNVSVVRRDMQAEPNAALGGHSDLRVLSIVCRPRQTSFLDPRYTPAALLDIAAQQRGLVMDFCRPPTLKALERTLRRGIERGTPYSVLHFDGHGTIVPELKSAALCFEDSEGNLDLVPADRLSGTLAPFGLTLVVLEACRSAAAWSGSATISEALLGSGIAAVLGMSYAVSMDSTRDLLSALFRSLTAGQEIGSALVSARRESTGRGGARLHPNMFVPQLYEGRPGAVFRSAAQAALSGVVLTLPSARVHSEPVLGRGWDLHGLERILTPFRVVAVTGIIGSGKTSLVNEMRTWWTRNGMFPDGVIYLSLTANSTPTTVALEVQRLLLGATTTAGTPVDCVAQALAARQSLIILDNYDRCLPPASYPHEPFVDFVKLARSWTAAKCRLIVCSRSAGTDVIEKTPNWIVFGLSIEAGIKLLRRSWRSALPSGLELKDSNDELADIVRLVNGHPGALKVIGTFLGKSEVLDSPYDLHLLLGADEGPWRAPLKEAVNRLSAEARSILPYYALLSPAATDQVFVDMLAVPADDLQKPVAELQRFGLVKIEHTTHHIHPLLPYLSEAAADTEIEARVVATVAALCRGLSQAFLSGNSATAVRVISMLEMPIRRALDTLCRAGREDEARAILSPMLYFLERSHRNADKARLTDRSNRLLAEAASSASAGSLLGSSFGMLRTANELLGRNNLKPHALLQALNRLVDEADGQDDPQIRLDQARVLFDIVKVCTDRTGDYRMALDVINRAERICSHYETVWDADHLWNLKSGLLGARAIALCNLGHFEKAMRAAELALEVSTRSGDQTSIARSYSRIGYVAQPAGRLEIAKDAYEKAIAIASETSDHVTLAYSYKGMGQVMISTRNFEAAETYLITALREYRTARDRSQELAVIGTLGSLAVARSDWEAVLGWCDLLEQNPDRADFPSIIAASLLDRSAALSELAENEAATAPQLRRDAIRAAKEGLSFFRTSSDTRSTVVSLLRYAETLRRDQQWELAEMTAREALTIQQALRIPLDSDPETLLEEIIHRQKLPVRAKPDHLVGEILRMALDCRCLVCLGEAGERVLASLSPGFLESLEVAAMWLHANFVALALVKARPDVFVPKPNRAAVEAAWREAETLTSADLR